MDASDDSAFIVLFERSLAVILREHGFDNVDISAYQQLLDVTNSILRRFLLNVKSLMEIQSRTEPCPADIARALQLMNVKLTSLRQTFAHPTKHRLRSPDRQLEVPPPKLFRVTQTTQNLSMISARKHRPLHIPDFLPDFPDPHTFVASETYADMRKDYTRARQALADQRRALQRSLVRFKLQTNETLSAVVSGSNSNEHSNYLLIKNTLSPLPYLAALLPHDQMDSDEATVTEEETTTANRSSTRSKSLSGTDDADM